MSDHVPIALQLYSIRELMGEDFEGTVRQVAEIGYEGVEVAALPDSVSPPDARALFDALGLSVVGVHSALPLGADREGVLETLALFDAPYLVCPWLNPETYFTSKEGIAQACALLNEANEVVRDAGMTLLYHNHWFEFKDLGGDYAYELLVKGLDETIGLELDTYWAEVAGQTLVRLLSNLGDRAPLLHLKDGPGTVEAAMTPLGAGIMDVPAILETASAEWLIVEIDRCDGEMLSVVEESYAYLKEL